MILFGGFKNKVLNLQRQTKTILSMKTQNEILQVKPTKELEHLNEINNQLIKLFQASNNKYLCNELLILKKQIENELLWRKRLR